MIDDCNRRVLLSSSKAWINLYVKNQRRQEYPFKCKTALDKTNNGGELRYYLDADLNYVLDVCSNFCPQNENFLQH